MTNQENGVDLKSAAAIENKKLFIETYGCQMNVADSEVVASIMQMDGYDMMLYLSIPALSVIMLNKKFMAVFNIFNR